MRAARALKLGWRALAASGGALVLASSACKHASQATSRTRGAGTAISVAVPPPTTELRARVDLACKVFAPNGCDVRDEACQTRLFDLARCLASRDGVRPPLRFVSEAESRQKLLEHRAEQGSALVDLEQAVRVLGLGQASMTSEPSDQGSGLGPNAYYAPRERTVFFLAYDDTPYAGELGALSVVHEYVHAIQDRHGELLRAQDGRNAQSFDQELALRSVFEGEATLCEEVARAFIHGVDPRTGIVERFARRTGASDDAIVRQRRPLEAALATFPYSYGAYWAALETAQPLSTHELLAKRHGWPLPDAPRCDDESPPSIAPDYPRRVRETLGAWLVQAYVRKASGDPEHARSAARRWRGDWLSIYSRVPGGPSSSIWQTCWDSAQTASEMRELIATQLRTSSGNRASVTNEGRVVIATVRAPGPGEAAIVVTEPPRRATSRIGADASYAIAIPIHEHVAHEAPRAAGGRSAVGKLRE